MSVTKTTAAGQLAALVTALDGEVLALEVAAMDADQVPDEVVRPLVAKLRKARRIITEAAEVLDGATASVCRTGAPPKKPGRMFGKEARR